VGERVPTTKMPKSKVGVELAGLYAVASKLCLEGYLAIPMPVGHYPEIDLVVHDKEKGRFVGVQVKTLKRKSDWYFPPTKVHPTVFVVLESQEFYVLERDAVDQIVKEMESKPPKERFLHKNKVETPQTKDNWENIWK
jgi:hypothetical protein